MTIPLPVPWVGQAEIQQDLDALAGQFPLGPSQTHHQIYPQARVYKSTDFTHNSTGNWLACTFDSERWDYYPAGYTEQHSTSANTSRLTCRVPGLYVIGGGGVWDTNTTGARGVGIYLNGTAFIQTDVGSPAATFTHQSVTTVWRLGVGDYVELHFYQNSGANRTLTSVAQYSIEFWFGWLSP